MKKMTALVMFAAMTALGFEYDVYQPEIKPQCKGATQGVWTLDWEAALSKAREEGKYTLVLFTGAWWCPYCHTQEKTVLTSTRWAEYVKEKGFYLAEVDHSYRYDVPEGQEWKSYHPEMGKGWGFKCWYMNPEFLAENNLSVEDGLMAIQRAYEYQGEMALPDAVSFTMKTWDGSADFTYGRIAYAAIVVFDPNGKVLGRVDFPWYKSTDVTPTEAQEFEIQAIDKIINGECALCEDPVKGSPDVTVAQLYTGWVEDPDAGVIGTVNIKLGRKNPRGLVSVSGTVTFGERKVSLAPNKVSSIEGKITLRKNEVVASVVFGATSMAGTVTDGSRTYAIGGGRDVFKVNDEMSRARAETCPRGIWNLVLKPLNSAVSPFARGYGTLSVDIKSKGKVKISGTLGDGTKVNASAQAIVGENGICCVPVHLGLYSKHGGLGFVIWFKNGKFLSVTDTSPWVAWGRNSFTTTYDVISTTSPGMGSVADEMDLMLSLPEGTTISGKAIVGDPSADIVTVTRNKWEGTDATSFKATCNAKTGALNGTLAFKVGDVKKPQRVKGLFTGIVMGGSGYGTVLVKNEGTWAVKVTACGSCSE